MGHSPSISEQAKTDSAFQAYITDRNKELDAATADAKAKMAEQIKAFYAAGGWTDSVPIASGAYQHLSTFSEWSLDHVVDMIEAVRGAVFGTSPRAKTVPANDAVPRAGSEDPAELSPLDGKSKTLLSMMGGTEVIIANAAFQAISGILASFKTSLSTDLVKNVVQKDLVPGLSMFVCVMENKFHQKSFFNDDVIIQNFYIFDVRMSASRAADIAKFDRLNGLLAQQVDLGTQASDLSNQIKTMNILEYKTKHQGNLQEALKDYKADFDALDAMMGELNSKIDGCGKAIDALRASSRANHAVAVATRRAELVAI